MSWTWKLRTLGFICVGVLTIGSAQAVDDDVLSREPAADAPKGVKDLQVLIGDWKCGSSNRQPDGTWEETSYIHVWKWYYTLRGKAIQDFWLPDEDSPSVAGTNLRMFDKDSDSWFIAWSTVEMKKFLHLSATFDGTELVLTGHRDASSDRPEHDLRVTFHNISPDHFDWRHEVMSADTNGEWREVGRLDCDRA